MATDKSVYGKPVGKIEDNVAPNVELVPREVEGGGWDLKSSTDFNNYQ